MVKRSAARKVMSTMMLKQVMLARMMSAIRSLLIFFGGSGFVIVGGFCGV